MVLNSDDQINRILMLFHRKKKTLIQLHTKLETQGCEMETREQRCVVA